MFIIFYQHTLIFFTTFRTLKRVKYLSKVVLPLFLLVESMLVAHHE